MSSEPTRDDENAPAWHLLPDDPVGFFGLQSGYDRKDLKRAYNALLRQYKPDKAPQEFQKLRAAFEQLDGELRYGQAPNLPRARIDDYQWKPSSQLPVQDREDQDSVKPRSESSSTPKSRDDQPTNAQPTDGNADQRSDDGAPSHSSTPHATSDDDLSGNAASSDLSDNDSPNGEQKAQAPKSLQERIESESLPELYEELKLNPREPYDYYVLALLSDAVADPEHLVFLRWLMSGIKAFPGQPALTQLLIAYFQDGDLPKDQLESVIVRLSQVLGSDRFYYLAEKLIDRLVLSAPWPKVEETLAKCATNVNDSAIHSRVVFTCHLLRRALWLAPLDKCQEMLSFINHHYEFLEGNLEYEQELNSLLLQYIETREKFMAKGPMAQMMDQALRAYCLDIDGRGDYEVVKVQAYIAQHPEQLFREFQLTSDENMQFLVPWIWVSDEVEDRLETQEEPPTPDRLMTATFHMLQQIDRNFPLTPIQVYNVMDRGVPLAISLFLVVGLPAIVGMTLDWLWPAASHVTGPGILVVGIGLAAFYWFWLQKRTTSVWLFNYLRGLIKKHYLRWWRSLIGRFFAATHFSYPHVDRAIESVLEQRRADLNISHWLPHFYRSDPSLYVYAVAVRFLR